MDKHLYPGTQFLARAGVTVHPFPGIATVIETDPAKNICKVKFEMLGTESEGNLDTIIGELEAGRYQFVLDNFTKGYLDCILWAESDQDDNMERNAREHGYMVEPLTGHPESRFYVMKDGEQMDDQSYEYARGEGGAWEAAHRLAGGGSCPDTPLENNYDRDDFAPSSLKDIIQDCLDFQAAQKDLLAEAYAGGYTDLRARGYGEWTVEEFGGHDFWLSRNGHGAGFFDRDLGDAGDKLQEAAQVYGSSNIYVGDDKKLYIM